MARILNKRLKTVEKLLRKFVQTTRVQTFCLVDLKLLFIIVSFYSTMETIISGAASKEATSDINSNKLFNLTLRPEHLDQPISRVSDTVLWNCRDQSVTSSYYKLLYGFLLSVYLVVIILFTATRITMILRLRTMLGSKLNTLLWQIAVVDQIKELFNNHGFIGSLKTVIRKRLHSIGLVDDREDKVLAKHKEDLKKLKKYFDHWEMGDEVRVNHAISLVPLFEVFALVIAVTLITTSYDPRPLACVIGPEDDLIVYNNITHGVDLNFSDGIRIYQSVAVSIAIAMFIIVAILFSMLVYFYHKKVVQVIKQKSELKSTQSDQDSPTTASLRQSHSIHVEETEV